MWSLWGGSAKSGGTRSGAGGSAYGGTPEDETPFICRRRYPPKRGLGRQAIIRRNALHLYDPVITTFNSNNLSIDLAKEALIGQRCSVPLGSPSSTHPPSSPSSSGYRPIQRTSAPSSSASTCSSSSIYATANACASPCPSGSRRTTSHDRPSNQDRARR